MYVFTFSIFSYLISDSVRVAMLVRVIVTKKWKSSDKAERKNK